MLRTKMSEEKKKQASLTAVAVAVTKPATVAEGPNSEAQEKDEHKSLAEAYREMTHSLADRKAKAKVSYEEEEDARISEIAKLAVRQEGGRTAASTSRVHRSASRTSRASDGSDAGDGAAAVGVTRPIKGQSHSPPNPKTVPAPSATKANAIAARTAAAAVVSSARSPNPKTPRR